ncbi:hypothetical protein BJ912DRAFT_1041958 [Pholiota molesta]|nr:hypothetical protein BJ912DRAFT_1041958 [Pholiota molesta]
MDSNERNSVVPIRAHLASIEVVGNLEGKPSKRPDHFVKVCVDDLKKDATVSDKKPRNPLPRWEWPETFQLAITFQEGSSLFALAAPSSSYSNRLVADPSRKIQAALRLVSLVSS